MPEDNPSGTTSEATSNPSDDGKGGTSDGGASGTGLAADDKFASERETLQAEARRHQAERDRASSENARLKAELDALKSPKSDETQSPIGGLTEAGVMETVRTAMRREAIRSRDLADAAVTAKEQYPNALASVYGRLDEYDSPEELMEQARVSHEALTAHIDARTQAAEKAIRDRYEAVHGPLPEPTAASGDAPVPTGDPTLEQLNRMTADELDVLEKDKPGVVDRVLRSADQLK